MRVGVKPELLRWACERAGLAGEACARRFPRLDAWTSGAAQPTLRQLENFATATHTPIGYLFLTEPPIEQVPLPDFRSPAVRQAARPSANLLDTIYLCQQRQEWYRDYARTMGDPRLPFVGSAKHGADVEATATTIRGALGFDLDARAKMPTWTDALRAFIEQADGAGIMVMCSGVVQNNTHRRLDRDEFGGFAMADDLAPLVFVNGADTKARQMFTLAHELVHVWLGQSGLSDADPRAVPNHDIEAWCNRVAAELLVPLEVIRAEYRRQRDLREEVRRLAHRFKVSTLVVLRRIHDAGGLDRQAFWREYDTEVGLLRAIPKGTGGSFYLSQTARVSKRFARALVVSTWEGHSSFTDAFRLLGIKKVSTFREMGHKLGMDF
ncbi:MAG: ImmA/IrrE family metallo-endopeptidase [Myxococcota bacterium]|nr:ImmA/IrrE family metallo-endopeptidase [Myxococcota bacterium]